MKRRRLWRTRGLWKVSWAVSEEKRLYGPAAVYVCAMSTTDITSRNAVSSKMCLSSSVLLRVLWSAGSESSLLRAGSLRSHWLCLASSLLKCLSGVTGQRSVTLFSTAAAICWSLYPSCIFWAVESSSNAVIIWRKIKKNHSSCVNIIF